MHTVTASPTPDYMLKSHLCMQTVSDSPNHASCLEHICAGRHFLILPLLITNLDHKVRQLVTFLSQLHGQSYITSQHHLHALIPSINYDGGVIISHKIIRGICGINDLFIIIYLFQYIQKFSIMSYNYSRWWTRHFSDSVVLSYKTIT